MLCECNVFLFIIMVSWIYYVLTLTFMLCSLKLNVMWCWMWGIEECLQWLTKCITKVSLQLYFDTNVLSLKNKRLQFAIIDVILWTACLSSLLYTWPVFRAGLREIEEESISIIVIKWLDFNKCLNKVLSILLPILTVKSTKLTNQVI